jgi:hypothetical protein
MVYAVQFLASLAIAAWGLTMIVLGLVGGMALWVLLGIAVLAIGVPLLASHPGAATRLYPARLEPPAP